MKAKDLYDQIEASGIRVDYREPDWILTRVADGKDLTLADLSPEQHKILSAIQSEEYWPERQEAEPYTDDPSVTAFDLACGDKIAKQDWIEAGNAAGDIDIAAVERVIGLPIPKKITDFEDLCAFVFLAIAGEKLPRCNLRGRGFRSQWHAAKVADVWPENDKVTASKAVAAVQPLKPELDEPVYCQTPDCESEAGCTVNRDDGAELRLCAVCASAFEMGRRQRDKGAAVTGAGYTPVDWRLIEVSDHLEIQDVETHELICTVDLDDAEIFDSDTNDPAKENARLITSAPRLNRERDELAARLQELAAAAREVCDPIFTASDGGAMWCAMRQRPRAVEDVERLKAAIARAEGEAV